jgi:hypothetical protein
MTLIERLEALLSHVLNNTIVIDVVTTTLSLCERNQLLGCIYLSYYAIRDYEKKRS